MKSAENELYNIKSLLFGLAVGDAVGVPFEFLSREEMELEPAEDMIGYGTYNQEAGTFSDDSSMSFALVEALIDGYDLNLIGKNFVKWFDEGYWTAHGYAFDIGNTTEIAISKLRNRASGKSGANGESGKSGKSGESVESGGKDDDDNGNGSLMRIAPLVFFVKDKDINERFKIMKEVSSITHGHIRSIIACFYYIEYLIQVLDGKDKFLIYEDLKKTVPEFLLEIDVEPEEINMFNRLLENNIYEYDEEEINSGGYVLSTLEASVYCLLTTNTYKESVLKAVNLGNDTDTTATVTGAMTGLLYGYDNIPEKWIKTLAKSNEIADLANRYSISLLD
ncbi:MAG: ADP-ribosylglycohydrolase family protein [Methanobrevibacter sp.]|jgi:ADP-ribosylglycohydrolase|nr:ADP-ribosylglycohydrolase family protein [Methanobrevibacter sp.]